MAYINNSDKVVVLIVEDDPLVRLIAAEAVAEAGFEALEAENADEAVRVLEQRSDIRIVFTDVDMPGPMDGLKLAIAVRGRWPPIEIIVTSGHRAVAARELPARSIFMPKPYRLDSVVETLRRLAA
jgi:DNA-binding NtrC family response regulator